MNIGIKKKIRAYGPYVLVVVLVMLPWFFVPGYLFFTDTVWGPTLGVSWSSNLFPFQLLVKALSYIMSVDLIEKLFFFASQSGMGYAAAIKP